MSTISWKKYREHTINRIADICWDPYWHAVINDTLHPDLLHLCNYHWPKGEWSPNSKGLNPNRRVYKLQSGSGFWQDYYANIMEHKDIQQAIYKLQGLTYTNNRKVMDHLYEDTTGYAVGNHVDSEVIDIAWQLYIAGDTGTNLNNELGECIKNIPFQSNTSWIIRNDAYSWHSCEEVKCDLRKSIMVRYLH